MKITAVRTQVYELDLDRKIGGASAPDGYERWISAVVSIETDEGPTGVWETFPGAVPHVRALGAELIGHDPRHVRGLWQRLMSKAFKFGAVGFVGHAIGALDVALWDLKAKVHGEPLWRMLGALDPKVRACYSPIDMPLTDDELSGLFARAASQGITAGQLKVGIDQDRDLRRLEIVKNQLEKAGRRPALGIDANEHWSPKQAIRKVTEFERAFDLTWVEEPARRWDYRGLQQVSRGVKTAVASGENLVSIGEYLALIDHHAVDIVQISHGAGGITGALQIADLAYGHELPVMMLPSPGMAMAHLAAVLPNIAYMDVFDGGADKVFMSDCRIEDGWVIPGDRPGHGLRIDEDALRRFAVDLDATTTPGPSPFGRGWSGAGYFEAPLPPTNGASPKEGRSVAT